MTQPLSMPTRVVVADPDAEAINRIRAMVSNDRRIAVIGSATDAGQLLGLTEMDPDVVLLSPALAPTDMPGLIRQMGEVAPHIQVLLLVTGTHDLDVPRAMLAGARGLVQLSGGPEALVGTIQEVMSLEQTRRQRMQVLTTERQARASQGRVIAVFSPKGGVGCTLLACNLGIAMQWAAKKPVALVDYSLQFGTVASTLNLHSLHTLAELIPHYEALDSMILNDVLVKHDSGMSVLLAPARLEDIELVTTESLVGILNALRQQYAYVVVDLWHTVEEATMAVLEATDTILLVTTPEVPALYTTRRFIEILKEYPQMRGKVQLVLNRLPSRGAVDQHEIEQSLGLPAIATIPSEGFMMTSAVNEGIPLLQKNANNAFARSVSRLAGSLVSESEPEGDETGPTRSRLFPRARRRP